MNYSNRNNNSQFNNNNTPFNSNDAFGGGGFMPQQTQQPTDHGSADHSSSKNRENQGLLPLTVKQLAQSYESSGDKFSFMVDGVDVNNITMVGMVFEKKDRTTDVTFCLDDGTGVINCQKWMNEPSDSTEMEAIQEGMYVRLYGSLKGFQGKKHFFIFSARPVTDFNDIAYHFIECMYVHAYNTKLQKPQVGGQTQPQRANPAMGMNGSMGHQVPIPSQFSRSYGSGAYTELDQAVLKYLSAPGLMANASGAHVTDVAKYLGVSAQAIRESIKSLETEGAVYSTIDEFHFKSAVNG